MHQPFDGIRCFQVLITYKRRGRPSCTPKFNCHSSIYMRINLPLHQTRLLVIVHFKNKLISYKLFPFFISYNDSLSYTNIKSFTIISYMTHNQSKTNKNHISLAEFFLLVCVDHSI